MSEKEPKKTIYPTEDPMDSHQFWTWAIRSNSLKHKKKAWKQMKDNGVDLFGFSEEIHKAMDK